MNRNILIVVAVIFGLVLLGGAVFAVSKFGSQVQLSLQKPASPVETQKPVVAINPVKLEIDSPLDKTSVKTPILTIKGNTLPGAEISINELNLKANVSGTFSAELKLEEGENPIIIEAFDADGNSNSVELTVTYEP